MKIFDRNMYMHGIYIYVHICIYIGSIDQFRIKLHLSYIFITMYLNIINI